jgi:Conserved TM helix
MVFADVFDRMQEAISVFFAWLPALLGALAILVIGYFVAKILGNLVGRVLQRAGLDRTLHSGRAGSWIAKVTSSPSRLLGRVTFWAILIGAISLAVTALGIDALTDFVAAIYSYLPNILMAFVIFLVASAIAGGVAGLVQRTMGDTGLGKLVSTVVPVIIMAIAGFMILDALEIASTIVTITYAALMGSIGLGMALAFGLGGREVAAQMLQGAYERGQANSEQWRRDLEYGREQARFEAERMRSERQERAEGDDLSGPPEPAPRVVTTGERQETVVRPGSTDRI